MKNSRKKHIGIIVLSIILLSGALLYLTYPTFTLSYEGKIINQFASINCDDFKVYAESKIYKKQIPHKYFKLNVSKTANESNVQVKVLVFDFINLNTPVPVDALKGIHVIYDDKKCFEGDLVDPDKIHVILDYSIPKKISIKEVSLPSNITEPLKSGKNRFTLKYKSFEGTLLVEAKEKTNVSEALKKIDPSSAQYHHISDTALVTITTKTTENGGFYYLSHIIINSPDQIFGGLSFGTYGGIRQLPTLNSNDNNWVIGTNGSYFSYESGEPVCAGLFIKGNQIKKDGVTNGKEICMKRDGTFFTPEEGITAEELLQEGVVENWGTADPLLLQNGERISTSAQVNDGAYPRTAIGMVRPCEYYLITAGSSDYDGGLTFSEMQDIFASLNCQYARSLDGGGSSSLVFEGRLLNSPAAKWERPVVDFLYFTD